MTSVLKSVLKARKARLAIVSLLCSSQLALGEPAAPAPPASLSPAAQPSLLGTQSGMITLDYAKITLSNGGSFDLFGVHYLQQLNSWLYGGFGFSTPLVEGNYGGFFAADATLHAQVNLYGNWFATGGLAFGAGAGGSSVSNIITLSGDGTYMRGYVGLGYDFGHSRAGVNLARITIANSQINDTTLNFFFQKPLSFAAGGYADTGRPLGPADFGRNWNETNVSFEFNYLNQIDPTGSYTGALGLVSSQISTYMRKNTYAFIGLDLGTSGLVWYNQAQIGAGRRVPLGEKLALYGQIGIGSGGWVTSAFDTGPGLVVYPKVRLEYALSESLAASLSAGYLFAPLGTSKNWSLGAGLNYRLPSAQQARAGAGQRGVTLRGLRSNVFMRRVMQPEANGNPLDDMNLLTFQIDYSLGGNWYIPFQIAAATDDYAGYAGYVEGLAGLGWQSDPFASGRLQAYAQLLTGMNDAISNPGPLLYPSAGLIYNMDGGLSLYTQLGKTLSLGQIIDPQSTNSFESLSLGLGLSYAFSRPAWARR